MKNLFKNLMLVAVAAMAFVACSQEGNEVNILTKETTFEFTAGFNEDTRSGFGEKEGDAYPSVWHGGESIIAIFSNEDGFIGAADSRIDDLGEGVESSKTATFTVKYEGSLPDNYSVTFYSGSWYTNYETGEAYYNISNNQHCTDTSVEASNHLCKTEAIEVVNGEISTLNLTFNTATAFGKVTMEQFSDVTDKISEVKVTINGDTTYTVTPNALTKPVVWFACEAIESVTSLIVEAKVDGVTYIKTKEDIAEGALSFNTGRIRPINVSAMTEKPADYNVVLTKVTKIDGNTISFAGEDSNDRLTLAINPGLEAIVAGTYIGVDAAYGPGFSSDSALEYNYNGSTFNISAAYNESYEFYLSGNPIVITDLGDNNFSITTTTSTWIPVDNANKTVKITYEGAIALPDSFTYLGRYYDIDSNTSTSGGGHMYKVVADGVEYSLELYWTYANTDGAIKVGTYNYCTNMPDYMSSEWNGFSIISDSYYYGSTLKATADGVTLTLKDADGNLIGEYVYEGVATFGNEPGTGGGGGGGEEPNPSGADGLTIDTAYTFTSYSTYQDFGYPVMCLSGAENGAEFNFESNSQTKYPTGMQYFNKGAWYTALCEYKINGVVQEVDHAKSITYLVEENGGFTVEYIYIVTTDGNGLYYKYDGVMTI